MSYPSVKTIENRLLVTHETALKIRTVMDGPGTHEARLKQIDEILHTHGVEYIPAGHNRRSPAISYCNTGDTYRDTCMVLHDNWLSYRFVIGNWGSIVERGDYD